MAATDKTYRLQKRLDVVFGVSCVLMLASIVWMFAQDYYRDYKVEARDFRDVEEAMAERQLLRLAPGPDKQEKIRAAEDKLADARAARDRVALEIKARIKNLVPQKFRAEAEAQALKANFDSLMSIYNIEVEKRDEAKAGSADAKTLDTRAANLYGEVQDLKRRNFDADLEVEKVNAEMTAHKADQKKLDLAVSDAEKELKNLNEEFDRWAKLTVQKKWRLGDAFRGLPVIDAFSSPTKIKQVTLNDLPIDYNFKYVTRYDRCTTCHLGIEQANFEKAELFKLTQEPSDDERARLKTAKEMLAEREKKLPDKKASFSAADISDKVVVLSKSKLPPSRITEYCAHPRLDLFVSGNSPHSAEKFGCTICHSGQGSATDFSLASHTPNDHAEKKRWSDQEGWESSHFWDFPMLPSRFLESSCLKCHHQVTDLLPEGDQTELRSDLDLKGKDAKIQERKKFQSPGSKVVRGYNLVRENGCFGCHEIAGFKGGRPVGPDLRLELVPPLEELTPAERAKALSDPTNPPGTMRKVGPSLRRISEKTNTQWIAAWLSAPRGFRPDTRMPHFYGLSNNRPDVLPDEQKEFPNAEMQAVAHYLMQESLGYLKANPQSTLLAGLLDGNKAPVRLPVAGADAQAQIKSGRLLFTEKGCLACHAHSGTEKSLGDLPTVIGEANFGPNLSRLAAKIDPQVKDQDPEARRRWLVQWIMNPNIHFPRTRMPVTHLNVDQAADIAAWLLSQKPDWELPDVPAAKTETLAKMARQYLEKAMPHRDVDDLLQNRGMIPEQLAAFQESHKEADEIRLRSTKDDAEWTNNLKWYVGKKAINQLGCFGCHEVPGFENSKPIGTPLNDWGKKDPERLAFEDVLAFVKKSYHFTEGKVDEEGNGYAPTDGKEAYEDFFLDSLEHHQRDGFLYQKLREPRSYDYNRLRSWEDRLRMPQFKFGRKVKPRDDKETLEQADARDEAEAREAVMTFVLGLLAEPIPLKFVYDPPVDKLAVAKGKQVLDKFNCAGCHQLSPGTFQFKSSPDLLNNLAKVYDELPKTPYKADQSGDDFDRDDPDFARHNIWVGREQPNPDRIVMRGLPVLGEGQRLEEKLAQLEKDQDLQIKLTEAVRIPGSDQSPHNIPAKEILAIPYGELTSSSAPEGGVFPDLIAQTVMKAHVRLNTEATARSALPPPLLREGERVQPGWLFEFLRHPTPIRPPLVKNQTGTEGGVMVLRMPRFNMSDDEAMTLVNYFGAADRLDNPAMGLNYPYITIDQRVDGFLTQKSREYVKRLEDDKQLDQRLKGYRDIWLEIRKKKIGELTDQVAAADKDLAALKDPDAKKSATRRRDDLKAELGKLVAENQQTGKDGAFLEELIGRWKNEQAYATDGYRLLANYTLCLNCHQVGNLEPKDFTGPPLTLAPERLRPDWTRRWIASPQRFLVYPGTLNHPMPNQFKKGFKNGKKDDLNMEYQEFFDGTSLQKATAIRDILMNYQHVSDLPENKLFRPTIEGGK